MKLKKKKKFSVRTNEVGWAYLFIAPTIIGLFFLNIKPAFDSIYMSFNRSTGFGNMEWAGLDNYRRLFSDPEVWQSVWNTLKYVIFVVPAVVAISLIVAVLLNQKIKGISIYRVLYFLPVVAAPAAVAMVWKWLFNSDYGLINYLLVKIGLDPLDWLVSPDHAIYVIIVVGIWAGIGTNMVILLAGLQEIPKDYYESAEIDGASGIKQFFSITLPLVTPTLFFVVVTTIIGAFQVFDVIFMTFLPNTAQMYEVQSLSYLFYKHSYLLNDKGYGSTIVVLLLVIILVITAIQLKLQKKWVNY